MGAKEAVKMGSLFFTNSLMPDKELYRILASLNDDYLSSTMCLKLIDQAFLALSVTRSFAQNPKREEMSPQLLELHHRLGNLFVYLAENDLSAESM